MLKQLFLILIVDSLISGIAQEGWGGVGGGVANDGSGTPIRLFGLGSRGGDGTGQSESWCI